MVKRTLVLAGVLLALTACQGDYASTKHLSPIPPATMALMTKKGLSKSDPILIRSFKKESEIEVWKRGSDGQYAHLKTYPMCRWSGQLGPKVREGDRQAPEGFYTVTPAQMNPNSSYYLSFDVGYPNAYDRSHGRTGAHLMVHGSCSSRGCFAMTDETIAEIFAIGRESFSGGQRNFQFQSYPFRMTAENMAKHRADPHIAFWKNLKEGSDLFEVAKHEPRVSVVGGRYVFNAPDDDAGIAAAVAEKRSNDDRKVAELVEKGTPAIKLVYDDGGQHVSFRQTMVATAGGESQGSFALLDSRAPKNLGDVSRPEALAMGPREIPIEGPAAKPKSEKASTMLAQAATAKGASTKTAERAKPATATEPVTVAQASAAPVSASPGIGREAKGVYNRMLGKMFGPPGAPAVETVQAEPAAAPPPPRRRPTPPVVATAPLTPAPAPVAQAAASRTANPAPERRAEAPSTPTGAPAARVAPRAANPAPERRAEGPAILPGAQPVLPAGGTGFARLN